MTPSAWPWGAVLLTGACAIDRWIGDPRRLLHPVQVMGWCIQGLRRAAESLCADHPLPLRLAGVAITLIVVGGSAAAGWGLERLALTRPLLGIPLLLVGMASVPAGASLERAVRSVLRALPDLHRARARLDGIVGRDVSELPEAEILRACAETTAENAVDGLFAPIFWMLIGAILWQLAPQGPGPLTCGWGFKAASTLDSMLGYRKGRLRWLGTAGARLDDLLTWIPCRLVLLGLPLAAGIPGRSLRIWRTALREGRRDPSPNAGVSQAAYANLLGVRLGGANRYGGKIRQKPVLGPDAMPDEGAIERMLSLTARLEWIWIVFSWALLLVVDQTL